MKLVFKTQDLVRLSFVQSLLKEKTIEHVVLDGETSSLYGGALPWVQRRVMVVDEDFDAAKRAILLGFKDADLIPDEDELA